MRFAFTRLLYWDLIFIFKFLITKEVLTPMEPDERKRKLQETFKVVEEGYKEILYYI